MYIGETVGRTADGQQADGGQTAAGGRTADGWRTAGGQTACRRRTADGRRMAVGQTADSGQRTGLWPPFFPFAIDAT